LRFDPWLFLLPGIAASITIAGAIGQLFDLPWFGSMGAGFIPLAPLSMVMILLAAGGLCANPFASDSAWIRRAILASGLLVFVLGLAVLAQTFLPGSVGSVMPLFLSKAAARVSPLTALAMGCAGLTLSLGSNPRFPPWLRQGGSLLALVPLGIGLFILFGYLAGVPALYGSDLIPMSMPSALCAVALGLAMLLAAGHDTWPQSLFIQKTKGESELPTLLAQPFGIFLILVAALWIGEALFLRKHVAHERQNVGENLLAIAELKA
jgi:hypothetical protein